MVALIPQLITVGIFIALLFGHAALTHYCFSSKHSNNRRAGVIATFTLGLGMIVFAFLFATFLFDAFSTTDVELFSFLSTIIPSYMESTRELTCAQLDVISPITTTMLMVTIAALYYTVQFTDTSLSAFTTYLTTIFISGIYFLYAQGPASIFAAYEFLLLPSSLMIDYFSKTVRAREATYFMVA